MKFESDLAYEILTGKVRPWNYGRFRNRYINVAVALRSVMTKNPALKVYVASGYYEAGHMMYINKESLIRLTGELSESVRGASN